MNKIKNFYDLDAWKRGHELVIGIYNLSKNFPIEEKFGIINQIRRAAFSVTANISEGFGRFYFKDKARFYYQARGSVFEVQNFLILAKDLEFISAKECEEFFRKYSEISQIINGLIRVIEKQKNK